MGGWEIFGEIKKISGGGLRNFRWGGVEKILGGLRNFRGVVRNFRGRSVKIFSGGGGWQFFAGVGTWLRNFRWGGGWYFFGRGWYFSWKRWAYFGISVGVEKFFRSGREIFSGGGESRFFREGLRFFGRTGLRNFREIENLLLGGGG